MDFLSNTSAVDPFMLVAVGSGVAHHGLHSGMNPLAGAVGAELWPEPERRSTSLVCRGLAQLSGKPWYHASAAALELRLARRSLSGYPTVAHYLLGENSFRYGGALSHSQFRTVVTLHQPLEILENLADPVESWLKADLITVVSDYQRRKLEERFGRLPIEVVPLGVDTTFFCPGKGKRQEDPPLILTVGHWLRDYPLLAQAWPLVKKRVPESELCILGRPGTGLELAHLPGVHYLTQVSDDSLREAYRQATLLALPLKDSTSNTALLEGMACGCPIVATDVGGVPEYLSNAKESLVPPGKPDALAEALVSLLLHGERQTLMSAKARVHTVEHFSWEVAAPRYHQAYRRAWSPRPLGEG